MAVSKASPATQLALRFLRWAQRLPKARAQEVPLFFFCVVCVLLFFFVFVFDWEVFWFFFGYGYDRKVVLMGSKDPGRVSSGLLNWKSEN